MATQPTFEFQWLSPLGLSVILFLLYGAVYLVIGALTPFMHRHRPADVDHFYAD